MADHVISPPEAALAAPFEHSRRQLEALLEVSEAIAQQRDLPALFHDLAARLHTVIDFDFLTLVLHDPAKNVMRLHVLETRIPSEKPTGSESAVEGHPSGWVWQTQQPFVFSDIDATLKRVILHDFTSLALLDPPTGLLKIHALDFPGRQGLIKEESVVPLDVSPSGRCFTSAQPLILRGAEIDRFDTEIIRLLRSEGVQTICCVPLITRGRTFGTLDLASRRSDAFSPSAVDLLQQVAAQTPIAVANALAFKQIDALKDKLAVEQLYLEEEIRSEFNFEEIIGEGASLKRALAQVELVAPAATTVLVLGETGTGKELIARAIHNLSPRRERTFVKINCAAIPAGLLESELFGHERGAFTGAVNQKIGRFELADRGTLFLDEVGDIPLELQPKLLRVLQEQEFERLGSNRTQRVDVRVVAATNGDLSKLVAERAFRSDL